MSLIRADARSIPLVDGCVDCVVTSPPYWGLRDYGTARWIGGDDACDHRKVTPGTAAIGKSTLDGGQKTNGHQQEGFLSHCGKCGAERIDQQIGLEALPTEYIESLRSVFAEVRRVLKDTGTVWLNLGDSYSQSGRGGNPADSPFRKQATNRGSITVGRGSQLNAGFHEVARQAGAVSRAWSGKAPEGLKPKDLVMIPARVALALQADGWYLRSDIIWHKPNPMPESVTDRPTKAHEYLFLLTKSERYYYDADAIKEPFSEESEERIRREYDRGMDGKHNSQKYRDVRGDAGNVNNQAGSRFHLLEKGRNRRSVWTIPTMPYAGAHFATMPEALVEPCILAGCPMGGMMLDPFSGSGTVLAVAERLGRRSVGVDLNPAYHELAKVRTAQRGLRFDEATA